MQKCASSFSLTRYSSDWVQGELVRKDVTEDQKGVPLTLDIQIIDVNTCKPVPEAFLEIWHCNSTGVYSGVVANGNGNYNDKTNINNTFLRGIQKSDSEGVVVMDTLFPGHYTGRTTHIHVMTSRNATVNANETLSGGSITHVGQMFFDQDLISLVTKQEPYASNTQTLTPNSKDYIMREEASDVDPVIEYVLLGDDVSEGLFGWLSFGMDTRNAFNVTPAAYLTDHGGVANNHSGGGMGPPPGGSGRPSGAIPTGTAPNGTGVPNSTPSGVLVSSSAASLASKTTLNSSSSKTSPLVSTSSDTPQGEFGYGRGHPSNRSATQSEACEREHNRPPKPNLSYPQPNQEP